MKKTFVSILMGLLVVASSFAYTISDGEKVLDKVYENAELGDVDYSCTITLISEKPGTPKEQAQFKVFERVAEEQFSMIYALLSMVAAISVTYSKKIQRYFKNKKGGK